MPTTDAARLLLFTAAVREPAEARVTPIRRYRLGRLPAQAARRAEGEPRYAYLKRSHD